MTVGVRCANCGATSDGSAKACGNCGAVIQSARSAAAASKRERRSSTADQRPVLVSPTDVDERSSWRRFLRRKGVVSSTVGIVAFLIGAVIGQQGMVTKASQDALRSQLSAAQSDLASTQAQLSTTQSQLSDQTQRAQQADQAAQAKAAKDYAARNAVLDQRKQTLDSQASSLSSRQADLAARTAAANANSFSDGLYSVGTDIQSGTYHTDGGDSCYWAKLNSNDTSDIADNNLGAGPQTVTINSPYFESKDCGTWTKVG